MVRRTTPTGCVLSKPSACTWSWPMSWTRRAAASSRSRPLRSMSPTRSGQLRSNTAGCPSGTGINVLSSIITHHHAGPAMAGTFSGARIGDTHTAAPRDGVTTMRWPGRPGRLPQWRTLADIDGGRSTGPPPRRTPVNPRCGENTSRLDTKSSSIGHTVDDFSAAQIRNHTGGPVAGHKGKPPPRAPQAGSHVACGSRQWRALNSFCLIPSAVAALTDNSSCCKTPPGPRLSKDPRHLSCVRRGCHTVQSLNE